MVACGKVGTELAGRGGGAGCVNPRLKCETWAPRQPMAIGRRKRLIAWPEMSDPILLKIQRAQKHIDELKVVLKSFKDSGPYSVSRKRDSKTGEWLIYIADAKPIPHDVELISGDIVQNLYCCLDYLAWEMVKAAGMKKPNSFTSFPISEEVPTTDKQIDRYNRQVDGMSEDAKRAIECMRPYRRENNRFWTLHKLNNLNKHRTLLTIGFASSKISGPAELMIRADIARHRPLEKGSILLRSTPDSVNHQQTQFLFDVALNEPEADCYARPLLLTMLECYSLVYRTVQSLSEYR